MCKATAIDKQVIAVEYLISNNSKFQNRNFRKAASTIQTRLNL